MKIEKVINELKNKDLFLGGNFDSSLEFSYISCDSRDIRKNTLFVCKGFTFKKEYLVKAIEMGAVCYLSEVDYEVGIPCILTNDVRASLAVVSKLFYPDSLVKVGVTGTKGKTTTVNFIHSILNQFVGYRTGFLSTIDYYTGKSYDKSHNTTPESLLLHRYLHEMEESNLKYVTMEVSSQATKLKRVYDMQFDIGCFLNIGLDHIAPLEHPDFEDYLHCKLEFLKQSSKVVVCKEIDFFDDVMDAVKDCEVFTYGYRDCDFVVSDVCRKDNITSFSVTYLGETKSYQIKIPGSFNVLNATCAVAVATLLGIDYRSIVKGLMETKVLGRMQLYEGAICPIIVDYAHNKLSFEALFQSIKEDFPNRKIIIVFGASGDKGRNRRKDLGECAGKNADYIILTADDPQTQSVVDISNDIAEYIKPYSKPYEIIEDREEAIKRAVSLAKEDNIIIVTGKSDETYQVVHGEYVYYKSDCKVVEELTTKVKE